ncbi:MAG: lipopolysaccharide heptosyltransferase family protein [Phycisphaerales bacterium]|nr:lipopolysaccharide heptosyltransferase family protein [Phycisphaerales bacterium]
MKLPERPRICMVMMSAIGDVVHALPVITAIKRHRPHARITWILQAPGAALVNGHKDVDEILIFDRKAGWRGFWNLRQQLKTRPFDVVLDLQCYLKASIITAMCRSPIKLGLDRARAKELNWLFTNTKIPAKPLNHVQSHFLEFLDAIEVPSEPLQWNIGPWTQERAWQAEFFAGMPKPRVALVAGTSNPLKDWLPERMRELIDALAAQGLQTILVGGNSAREIALGEMLAQQCAHAPKNALGSGVRNLVSILDGCDLVISPDTGPLHLAVALGKPVIGLYGYNSPTRVGPFRNDHKLLVDAYHNAGEAPQMTFAHRQGRMRQITVQNVLDRVDYWRALKQ